MVGRTENWLKSRVHGDCEDEPGRKPARVVALAVTSRLREIAMMAVTLPCMIAVPKPRTTQSQRRVPSTDEVVDVLDRGEAGADGETEDRRIHQEADPVAQDEVDDDRALQRALRRRAPQ